MNSFLLFYFELEFPGTENLVILWTLYVPLFLALQFILHWEASLT